MTDSVSLLVTSLFRFSTFFMSQFWQEFVLPGVTIVPQFLSSSRKEFSHETEFVQVYDSKKFISKVDSLQRL